MELINSNDKLGVLVSPDMLLGDAGANINGPSLIRIPDWIPNPLGRYYLYFAHHEGRYIRLAYSDDLLGPYRIHRPGSLRLDQCRKVGGHIASPDVHIDYERRRIVMYFHGPSRAMKRQMSYRAESIDGINFAPTGGELGIFYFRAWAYDGAHYALGKARLYRSDNGGRSFTEGPSVLEVTGSGRDLNEPGNIRHIAVRVRGDVLEVYCTLQGEAPEAIRMGKIVMTGNWSDWRMSDPLLVLAPTEAWEGAELPSTPSVSGGSYWPEHAVRDPAIYQEGDQTYLLYTVMGERGIAIARVPS